MAGPPTPPGISLAATLDAPRARALINSWLPLEIALAPMHHPERVLALDLADEVTLTDGVGVRVATRGRLRWPMPVLRDTHPLNRVVIMLRPRIVTDGANGPSLRVDLELEDLDIAGVPGLVDAGVERLAQRGLRRFSARLVWAIGRALSYARDLPDAVRSAKRFGFCVTDMDVTVSATHIALTGVGMLTVLLAGAQAREAS